MDHKIVDGVKFSKDTSAEVIKAIQQCMDKDIRAKIDFGDTRTGEPFNQAFQAFGYIKAKTDGEAKFPILVSDRKSMKGERLDDNFIIRIEAASGDGGGLLYQHPNYRVKHKKTSRDVGRNWEVKEEK